MTSLRRRYDWSLGRRPAGALWVGFLLATLMGCSHVGLKPPEGFVELEDHGSMYDVRITDAHGVVIAGRSYRNEGSGTLAFWTDAIRNSLRMHGGYALLEEVDVKASTGQTGKQLRFGRDEDGQAFLYWLNVFVTPQRVYVVEAGGRKDRFEAVAAEVDTALSAVQLK